MKSGNPPVPVPSAITAPPAAPKPRRTSKHFTFFPAEIKKSGETEQKTYQAVAVSKSQPVTTSAAATAAEESLTRDRPKSLSIDVKLIPEASGSILSELQCIFRTLQVRFDAYQFAHVIAEATTALKFYPNNSVLLLYRAHAYRHNFDIPNAYRDLVVLANMEGVSSEIKMKLQDNLMAEIKYMDAKSISLQESHKRFKKRLLLRSVAKAEYDKDCIMTIQADDNGFNPGIVYKYSYYDNRMLSLKWHNREYVVKGQLKSRGRIDRYLMQSSVAGVTDRIVEFTPNGNEEDIQAMLNNAFYSRWSDNEYKVNHCNIVQFNYIDTHKTQNTMIISSANAYTEKSVIEMFYESDCTPDQWMMIYYAIATELQRIHGLGFLHGNIDYTNILLETDWSVPAVNAKFIHFYDAYQFTDASVTLFSEEEVIPHENQDVHRLGIMMDDLLSESNEEKLDDSLLRWMSDAISENPAERPTLDALLNLPIMAKQRALLFSVESNEGSTDNVEFDTSAITKTTAILTPTLK